MCSLTTVNNFVLNPVCCQYLCASLSYPVSFVVDAVDVLVEHAWENAWWQPRRVGFLLVYSIREIINLIDY
jgi:hypothetical protein